MCQQLVSYRDHHHHHHNTYHLGDLHAEWQLCESRQRVYDQEGADAPAVPVLAAYVGYWILYEM